ncbi:hypothetical protein APHAL10511_004511 [Amanita phalloides]|nr:hypothetical protein APHAL10511_004511 [Amanita phalloides]
MDISIPHKSYFTAALVLAILYSFRRRPRNRYISNLATVAPQYDVIVVGGGTAGCALAARLSEDPSVNVLLIEAGGSGRAHVRSRTPSMFIKLLFSKYLFNFETEPQVHAKNKREYWPRAKLLGGCSSINAQMAQYGDPEDFDEWAKIIGDKSWAWDNFSRYFRKFERFQQHPDGPQVDPSLHGNNGPIKIGFFNTISDISKAFIKTCVNVGIPFTSDFNTSVGTLGAGRNMTYIDENRQRVSSETAYLTRDALARPNLTVVVHATVTRILFETSASGMRASGVEFAKSADGPRHHAVAKRDIVLSAGAIHSPHILKLSGVGPAEELKKYGIPVVLNQPAVGANLIDHPCIHLTFQDSQNGSLKYLNPSNMFEAAKTILATLQYFSGFGGPVASNFGEAVAFVRSDDPDLYPRQQFPEQLPDSTSGPRAPDLELFVTPIGFEDHGRVTWDVGTYGLHCYLLRPLSRGRVFLKNPNPWDLPGVDPNYLQDPSDAVKLLRGVKLLSKIARAQPVASLLDQSCNRDDLDHQVHLKSDDEVLDLVRTRITTVYHPTTTCRMAPADRGGVVDTQLRVYGVKGLRVCDASIFPNIVAGHTSGACYAIAEKLADDMKAEYSS